jgi:multiple sugar transport system ATP-binding protein
MNLFDAELTRNDDGYTVSLGGVTVPLSAEKAQRLAAKGVESRKVILGLRPIHAALSETGGVIGTVDVSEMMGGEVHLHINALGRSAILIIPTTELSGRLISMGDEVRFTFDGALVHVFDPETEENLEF